MNLTKYKKASRFKVRDWIEEIVPELNNYQSNKLRDYFLENYPPFLILERQRSKNKFFVETNITKTNS